MNLTFNQLCMPAQIYFAMALIASVLAIFNKAPIMAILLKLVFAFAWAFALNWLCRKGYKNVSWFLVVFPYVVIVCAMMNMKKM